MEAELKILHISEVFNFQHYLKSYCSVVNLKHLPIIGVVFKMQAGCLLCILYEGNTMQEGNKLSTIQKVFFRGWINIFGFQITLSPW